MRQNPVGRCGARYLLYVACGLAMAVSGAGPAWADSGSSAGTGPARSIGDTQVFARVPDPGQPGGVAVDRDRVLVTTVGLLQPTAAPPRLFVYDRKTGELRHSWVIPPMMSPSSMQLLGVAVDASRRAYVVDMNGRVVRIDPETGKQETYAMFPAAAGGVGTMPFDIVFDKAGYAYVTDQNVPVIWRIPPGGGEPEMWFRDPRLVGYDYGEGGIRIDPSGRWLYFTVAVSQYPASAGAGLIYRLPLVDRPKADQLHEVFRYPAKTMSFGLALGATGNLYVTLDGTHQVSVLAPDGDGVMREQTRFPSAEDNARREVPYDTPIGMAMDGCGSMFVANSNAFSFPDPNRWVVFRVFVGDRGAPLEKPVIGGSGHARSSPESDCQPG